MRTLISLALAAVVAVIIAGCAHGPEWLRPPQQFQVSIYKAGQKVQSFTDTKSNTSTTQNYELQLSESVEETLSDTGADSFVIEPAGTPSAQNPTDSSKVKVTLRSGGVAVRVFYAEQFDEQNGNTYLQTPGAKYCVIVRGEVTVESHGTNPGINAGPPQSETPRCLRQPK
jgi:hypothetical protein